MDTNPLVLNVEVDDVCFANTLIDNGCLSYGLVTSKFAKKNGLQRIPVPPIPMWDYAHRTQDHITEIAYVSLDIGGHRQKGIFLYVVKRIGGHDMILGKPWLSYSRTQILPDGDDQKLRFEDTGIELRNEARGEHSMDIAAVSANAFSLWNQSKYRRRGVKVFAASMADIEKALRVKQYTDPKIKLPSCYHEFLDVFNRKIADKLPPLRGLDIDHKIELTKDDNGKVQEAPWGPLYNMSREELMVLRKTLTELLDKGFIRVSKSPAAAPVLFVHKPGGGLRFCCDYRALNKITRKDRYPLPLIRETLERIGRARWFTKMDVIAAFNKIRIAEGDEWLTAFRTRYGLYEWLVTPFGLANAPSTFQKYINWTLRDYLDEFVSAYLDDILVFSSGSLDDHRRKVKKVLKRLQEAGLQLDIDKCEFETTSTKYLGFIIEAEKGIRMDPEKIAAIQEWETPKSLKEVRSFLGFANFYRRFIKNYSDIAKPLIDLTRKDTAFNWTKEADSSFKLFKELFTTAPVLMHFDPDKETVVEADSSGYCIGGLLSQYDDKGLLRPVAYYSRKNSPAECNYQIYDKELLAIVRCLKEWESELRSVREFTVVTDHKNLKYFTTLRRLSERQMRWSDFLSKFNFQITYRPGKLGTRPDALSRRAQDMPQEGDERYLARERRLFDPAILRPNTVIKVAAVTRRQAREGLGTLTEDTTYHEPVDVGTESSRNSLEKTYDNVIGQPSPDSTELAEIRHESEDADMQFPRSNGNANLREHSSDNSYNEDTLQSLWERAKQEDPAFDVLHAAVREKAPRFPTHAGIKVSISECSLDADGALLFRGRKWVPEYEPLRTRLMQDVHDSVLTGHPGREATQAILSRSFFWPGISSDVRRFTRNCHQCRGNHAWRERRHGLLKPLPIPDRIWREISIDFVTELPESEGHTNIMVITDRLSKGVILEPMESIDALYVAKKFISVFYRHHGIPTAIVSDRGTQFVSMFWAHFCRLLGITRRLSTAYHPETDGSTERANQTMEIYLRFFCNYKQDNWAPLLSSAELAVNNRDSVSTGISPFFLTHGYHLEVLDLKEPSVTKQDNKSPTQRAEEMVAKLKDCREFAEVAMANAQQTYEEIANRSRTPAPQYQVGDKVWLDLRHIKTDRPCKKLDARAAQFTVIECIGSHAYRLNTPPGIHNVFHTMLLRPVNNDPFPSQKQTDWQPTAILVEDDTGEHEEWQVEKILDERIRRIGRGQRREFYVKWTGYSRPTWELASAFEDTVALDRYEARKVEEGLRIGRG